MWKLTIEDDEGQRTSLDLNQGEYTIGRAEDCDIRLTERNVSRRHCAVRSAAAEGWEIVDEGSYNGTYVNGERVTSDGVALHSGDIVNIGDYRIELTDARQQQQQEAEPRQRRPDRLVMVIGPTPGLEYALVGDRLGIGRAEEAAVSINHASVSRMHAELHNLGHGRWEVVDQGSSNGIRINGVELRRGIIEPGDALELGDVRLRFVAAGKFFRPTTDLSQQLPAMPFEGMTAAAGPPSGQRSVGVVVAALLVLGAIGVGAWMMFSGKGNTGPQATSAAPINPGEARSLLEQAKELAAKGDLQGAHKLIDQIAEESPVRESKELQDIEDKWADEMFTKADQTQDPDEKVRILELISDAVSVSPEKRKEAARRSLEVKPIENLDDPAPAPAPTPVKSLDDDDDDYPNTPATSGSRSPTTPSASKSAQPPSKSPSNGEKTRLLSKVQSGSASESEIRQLKALCMLDGDRQCRAIAMAALKNVQEK